MNWKVLTTEVQWLAVEQESGEIPVMIFKHSPTCSISRLALDRLTSQWDTSIRSSNYFLDVLEHRSISNQLEEVWGVKHESPQVIIIYEGSVYCHSSHLGINFSQIRDLLTKANEGLPSPC